MTGPFHETQLASPGRASRPLGVPVLLTAVVCLVALGFWCNAIRPGVPVPAVWTRTLLSLLCVTAVAVLGAIARLSNRQLRESEWMYRQGFETAVDGMVLYTPEGKVADANPAACAMYGYSREEFRRRQARDVIHPACFTLFMQFRRQLREGGAFSAESVDVRKDGTSFPVEVRGAVVSLGGNSY